MLSTIGTPKKRRKKMGYNTSYSLEVRNLPEGVDPDEVIRRLREWNEWALWCLDECGMAYEDGKWYDSFEDLTEFSSREENKDVLFILRGEGDEPGDIWKAFFRNGEFLETVKGEVIFPGEEKYK